MNKLAEVDLEFFQVVMGWNVNRLEQLPSFSVARGDELGWALLNRELKACFLVRDFTVKGNYLVLVQKQIAKPIAIGEGETLALATTLALIHLNEFKFANLQQIQCLNQMTSENYLKHLEAISKCYLVFQQRKIFNKDLKIAV